MKVRHAKFSDDYTVWAESPLAPTLTTAGNASEGFVNVLVADPVIGFAADQHHAQASRDLFPTLRSSGKSSSVLAGGLVRRLTPEECEALQGWPPGFTAQGVDESGRVRPLSDTPRYRMIGNGVAAPCAEWVARRIVAAHGAVDPGPVWSPPLPFDVALPEARAAQRRSRDFELPFHPEWAVRSVFFDQKRQKWRAKYKMNGRLTVRTFGSEEDGFAWLHAEAERHGAPSAPSTSLVAPPSRHAHTEEISGAPE